MIRYIAVLVIVSISLVQVSEENQKDLKLDTVVSKLLIEKYWRKKEIDPGETAEINEFAEKIFVNFYKYAVKHNIQSIALDNVTADVLVASVKLTNGSLHGISNITNYKDVLVNYKHANRELTLIFPLKFSDIKFVYNYEVHVVGMGPKGHLIGEISDFKFYLVLCFDMTTLSFNIKELRTTDSGHFSIKVDGNVTDFIFNILSEVVTTVLHPIIQGIIEGIIKLIAHNIVDDINKLISNIIHPNATFVNELTKYIVN